MLSKAPGHPYALAVSNTRSSTSDSELSDHFLRLYYGVGKIVSENNIEDATDGNVTTRSHSLMLHIRKVLGSNIGPDVADPV
jgi:hypothetical protein